MGNNPVNYIDPTGHVREEDGGGGVDNLIVPGSGQEVSLLGSSDESGRQTNALSTTGLTVSYSGLKCQTSTSVGSANFSASSSTGNAELTASPLYVNVGVSGESVEAAATLGNKYVNGGGVVDGQVGSAEAGIGFANGNFKAKAVAAVAKGEAGARLNVFGLQVTLGIQGCAVCAGGGVSLGANGHIEVAALLGVGFFWDIKLK